MIPIVVNVNLLREIDERKLIRAYARYMVNNESDYSDDTIIRENLKKLLDWDINGDNGLAIYCGKFEKLKEKDWIKLIQFIKENHYEIEHLSRSFIKERTLESIKVINDALKAKEFRDKERCSDENYKVSGRGKKARSCIYEGKEYQSRQECMYKEGLTKNQLYQYLRKTSQL